MEVKVRHPRLDGYYGSVVMNFATMGVALSAMFMRYSDYDIMACVSAVMFAGIMVGYSLWYWIGDVKDVRTCGWLSDMTGTYVLYFLITMAIKNPSEWWLMFALVMAICALMGYLLQK